MSKAIFALVFVLIVGFASICIPTTLGASSTPMRVFYLAASSTLSSKPPSSSCPTCITNITASPSTFSLPTALESAATVNGPITFSLIIEWTGNLSNSVPVTLSAAFSYRFPGAGSWTNTNSTPQRIFPGPSNISISLPMSSTPLIQTSSIAIELAATPVPRNAAIALKWGSSTARSFVIVPMSDYEGLFPANTIFVQDRSGTPQTYFYLDAAPPNNYVVVKAFAFSSFGIGEIQQGRVNMTILAPGGRPVRGAMNETMSIATSTSPYELIAAWAYPSNSTQGTYLVDIDMLDSQGNLVYSFFSGLGGTFGLVPPGFVPFPYNLLPYFVVAGVGGIGAVGGVIYYRRRSKSYLAPFGHFNTLTAGEIDRGTVSIEGNTGSGKTILSEQLMFEDLKRGKPCIFVSTSDFPSNVRSGMKSMGLDVKGYEQSGLLTFVDAYSAEAGQESTEKFSVPSIGDLTTLGMKISSSLPSESKGASLYFDSLVPLASKTKPESIVSFVQSIGAKMRGIGGKAVFTLGPSVDPMVQKQLEDMSDCVVQMEAFEERGVRRRRLKIAKLRARRHQEGWNVFAIEDGKGIIFYSKKPKT